MTAAMPSPRLKLAYGVALALHGLFVAALVAFGLLRVAMLGTQADAARGGIVLGLLLFLVTLVPAVPSIIALLSWWMCRRRGWAPSEGHMKLAIGGIGVLFLILALGAVL
ncbi:MAG: hypothetical protein RIG84_14815 [Roseovarius sp.]